MVRLADLVLLSVILLFKIYHDRYYSERMQ